MSQHPTSLTGRPTDAQVRAHRRRAFAGALSGHAIEWYDYGIYGFLAVFMGQLFFASEDPATRIISSFAVFALSFFMRPLGGLFLGPLSDKFGRKKLLLFVIVAMSGSTFLIGLLPTYTSIGVFAPILLVLLRSVQGFSAGGEIGTATAFIAEYAGPHRRGYSTSWLMVTAVMGLVLGSLVANGVSVLLGEHAMLAWGWRAPFLVAGPLGAVSLYIRFKLEDTPEFQALTARGETRESPLRAAMGWLRPILLVFGFITLHSSIFYLVLTFASTFMTTHIGYTPSQKFWAVIAGGVLAAVVMPIGGHITDRIGRKPFLMVTGALATASMLWFFMAAPGATPGSFLWTFLACSVTFGLYASSTYALMTELLPAHVRSTGIALGYNVPVAVFGRSAPFIATWLISLRGNITDPWYFFVGTGAISLLALALLSTTDLECVRDITDPVLPPDLHHGHESGPVAGEQPSAMAGDIEGEAAL